MTPLPSTTRLQLRRRSQDFSQGVSLSLPYLYGKFELRRGGRFSPRFRKPSWIGRRSGKVWAETRVLLLGAVTDNRLQQSKLERFNRIMVPGELSRKPILLLLADNLLLAAANLLLQHLLWANHTNSTSSPIPTTINNTFQLTYSFYKLTYIYLLPSK